MPPAEHPTEPITLSRPPLKILMVIPWYSPIVAGAEVFAQEVSEELVRRGHHVEVLTRGARMSSGGMLPKKEVVNGVHVHRILSRLCDGSSHSTQSPVNAALSVPVLAVHTGHLLRKLQPDILHSHVFPAGVAATLGSLGKRVANIYSEQQAGFKDYHPFLDNAFGHGLQSWINRRSSVVHATSQAGATFAREHRAHKAVVIPNGVHLPTAFSEKEWQQGDTLRICTVSRLEYKNGIDLVLRAAAALAARGIVKQIHVDILGDGSALASLKQLCDELELTEQVSFHGYIAHHNIWSYLQESHLFVRPSRQEGFGISFLEAMAAGVITIGTDVGGIPDILQDGNNGYLAKADDLESLIDVIGKALKQADTWPTLRQQARRDVTEKFQWDRITDSIEDLYYNLTSS